MTLTTGTVALPALQGSLLTEPELQDGSEGCGDPSFHHYLSLFWSDRDNLPAAPDL